MTNSNRIYAAQVGANGAFLARQKRKVMTYEKAVLRQILLVNVAYVVSEWLAE